MYKGEIYYDWLWRYFYINKRYFRFGEKIKNQEIIEKLMDLQQLIIDEREENVELREKIKSLQETIELLEKSSEIEEELDFSERGFCIKKNVSKRIPYCSHCWTVKHKLIPLAQQPTGGWWKYKCGSCGVDVVVLDESGDDINSDKNGKI